MTPALRGRAAITETRELSGWIDTIGADKAVSSDAFRLAHILTRWFGSDDADRHEGVIRVGWEELGSFRDLLGRELEHAMGELINRDHVTYGATEDRRWTGYVLLRQKPLRRRAPPKLKVVA